MLGEPALASFRLGHRKISDTNRAVNGVQSRPEHGVITIMITIMITITIMIMITMRKHPCNLPASAADHRPATDRLPSLTSRLQAAIVEQSFNPRFGFWPS